MDVKKALLQRKLEGLGYMTFELTQSELIEVVQELIKIPNIRYQTYIVEDFYEKPTYDVVVDLVTINEIDLDGGKVWL